MKPFLPSERTAPKNTFGRTIIRSAIAMGRSLGGGDAVSVAEQEWPGDQETKAYFKQGADDFFRQRAASTITSTATSNVPTSTTLEILPTVLGPASCSGNAIQLSPNKLSFGNSSAIATAEVTASGAGFSFINQGSTFPFHQMALSQSLMTPKKLAFGLAVTDELYTHTNAEAFLTPVVARNLSLGMETVLLDAETETTTRPAGLKAGISATAADTGTGQDAVVNDLSNLASIVSAVSPNNFCFIMSPKQFVHFLLRKPSDFKIPTFCSGALADGQVACLGLDAFMIAGGGVPRFEISKTATVVMDDAAGPISAVGTPNTVAAPISSAYQQNLVLIQFVADIDWQLRNASGFCVDRERNLGWRW